eukprot:2078676-Pleurochrysis_carterae.AAC.2
MPLEATLSRILVPGTHSFGGLTSTHLPEGSSTLILPPGGQLGGICTLIFSLVNLLKACLGRRNCSRWPGRIVCGTDESGLAVALRDWHLRSAGVASCGIFHGAEGADEDDILLVADDNRVRRVRAAAALATAARRNARCPLAAMRGATSASPPASDQPVLVAAAMAVAAAALAAAATAAAVAAAFAAAAAAMAAGTAVGATAAEAESAAATVAAIAGAARARAASSALLMPAARMQQVVPH